VPGAIAAELTDGLFWWSLATSLVIAFVAAVPVNRWLIARGRGHAVVHQYHHGHGAHQHPGPPARSQSILVEQEPGSPPPPYNAKVQALGLCPRPRPWRSHGGP